jgi:hypothetical protein
VRDSLSYQIEESSLECPALESNQIFKNLRNRLRHFTFQQEDHRRKGPSRAQLEQEKKSGVGFSFKIQLYRGLKRLLREVVIT